MNINRDSFMFFLCLLLAPLSWSADGAGGADLVLRHGEIYTVNEKNPWVESLAVKAGKIVFAGDDARAGRFITPRTRVVDLAGRFVMPGIHDVHSHPLEAGNPAAGACLLRAGIPVRQQLAKIRSCAKEQAGNAWVLGWGFDFDDLLGEGPSPLQVLDQAVPDRPALMMDFTSHSVWANSKALLLAGIDASSVNPVGGIIGKDRDGELNGILIDNAGNLVWEYVLAPNKHLLDRTYQGLLIALKKLAQHGITSLADARVYWTRGHHKVWQRAERENALTARVVLSLWAYPQFDDRQIATLRSLYRNDESRLLRRSQIKLYADGITGIATAAMKQPYLYDFGFVKGNRGLNYFDQNRMTRFIRALEKTGFDFHIHAIGDRAVHEALNAIEAVAKETEHGLTPARRKARHRLTHLEIVDPLDIPRFKSLAVIADFQLSGEWTQPDVYKDQSAYLLGKRADKAIPIRSVFETGAVVTLSSDYDVGPMNPFIGMQHAMMRRDQNLPTLDSVIRAYTINGAFTLRQEHRVGSLEVGKLADLIVLDRNLFEAEPARLSQTRVLWTLLGGKEVYRAPQFNPKNVVAVPDGAH